MINANSPWQIRFAGASEYISLALLLSGAMIGRTGYLVTGVATFLIAVITRLVFHATNPKSRRRKRTTSTGWLKDNELTLLPGDSRASDEDTQ